jgi:hypothetical protein
MKASKIRPGLLVALKSRVAGGIHYRRVDLDAPDDATARWETTRTIDNPDEHERAVKARGLALTEIRRVCSATSFGLLCPEAYEGDLDAAIERAASVVRSFNATAECTRVDVFALKGRVAATDEEAARAIGDEVAEMLRGMEAGIDRLDPEAIRLAATKARELSAMLAPEQAERVADAIGAARKAAREIVKRVQKAGEPAAEVLRSLSRSAIEKARMAFLDLDDSGEVQGDALPAVAVQRFGDLDLEAAPVPVPEPHRAPVALDFGVPAAIVSAPVAPKQLDLGEVA